MTMSAIAKKIPAGEFKAKCLALLDRVEETLEPIVITKRGRAVAQLIPISRPKQKSLRGSVKYLGNIVAPLKESWDVDS